MLRVAFHLANRSKWDRRLFFGFENFFLAVLTLVGILCEVLLASGARLGNLLSHQSCSFASSAEPISSAVLAGPALVRNASLFAFLQSSLRAID